MKDKENWVNMYVYKHAHFGNRISNSAESTHASLKHSLGTSLGKLKTVTLKVKKWYDKLVADRKHWLMVESLGEGTKIVFNKVNAARLNDIRLKVYHLTIQNATPVLPNTNNIKPITPEFNYVLELICKYFANAQSKQEQINIYQLIEKTLKQIDAQKLKNLKGPTVVEAIKGRSKNTKRKMIALEHCINTEKEKIIKKIKTEKEQKNRWKLWVQGDSNGSVPGPGGVIKKHGNMSASNNPLIRSLQDKHSPLPQQYWFGTINHPQLVADTFSRAVTFFNLLAFACLISVQFVVYQLSIPPLSYVMTSTYISEVAKQYLIAQGALYLRNHIIFTCSSGSSIDYIFEKDRGYSYRCSGLNSIGATCCKKEIKSKRLDSFFAQRHLSYDIVIQGIYYWLNRIPRMTMGEVLMPIVNLLLLKLMKANLERGNITEDIE
ncbi:hypothetical protein PHYBLDRAFT_175471 [Phycomyces blakesleeanus NRRL 1555(-)]|uniref:Uncharacterized protein n=1 Tax=Phycomyces blakesleeanus (strain ATCC 8743b / DSM 1359 / FGSC 10004 / NBRC 33097 / NRRL 1555) TaxID=763407 RepID=A0A167JKG6_PHYB8|nr:hypothetical protein PHYBLDRAFT_175471 [Phycomyces blakesleeanus NRRL 1555(-)]OAD66176.1 hypothetical protein PHYBLDRAFT_175471 [Phycomyces blakesleeanus NRRL 1555(-)]|eukprot:XP_018284216.1 hypothetical protein PHYBLDRAFT_175471 [Phycomyces blakesleeanus NRRL 1555(-)]